MVSLTKSPQRLVLGHQWSLFPWSPSRQHKLYISPAFVVNQADNMAAILDYEIPAMGDDSSTPAPEMGSFDIRGGIANSTNISSAAPFENLCRVFGSTTWGVIHTFLIIYALLTSSALAAVLYRLNQNRKTAKYFCSLARRNFWLPAALLRGNSLRYRDLGFWARNLEKASTAPPHFVGEHLGMQGAPGEWINLAQPDHSLRENSAAFANLTSSFEKERRVTPNVPADSAITSESKTIDGGDVQPDVSTGKDGEVIVEVHA